MDPAVDLLILGAWMGSIVRPAAPGAGLGMARSRA